MSNKLKIYACSGIGDANGNNKRFTYFTDGTDGISSTQAVNSLLAKINCTYIKAMYLAGISKEEKIDLLCDVDVYSVALEAAKRYTKDEDMLRRAGMVIGMMIRDGLFEFDSLDARKREDHLDELVKRFDEYVSDEQPITDVDQTWMDWWQNNVMTRNQCGFNFGQQQNIRKALKKASEIKGISSVDPDWKEDPNISKYLLNAGDYFLYTYFTPTQLARLPKVFTTKHKKEIEVYKYCKAYFDGVYGSEEMMQEIIYSGIVKDFNDTPQNVCAYIAASGRDVKPVGLSEKIIIAIIAAVVSVVLAIITSVCDAVYKSNAAKYTALDQSIINGGCPDELDYEGLGGYDIGGSTKSWIPIAIVGAGLLFLLK